MIIKLTIELTILFFCFKTTVEKKQKKNLEIIQKMTEMRI